MFQGNDLSGKSTFPPVVYIAMGMDIEILGGVGVIGMQLNFTTILLFAFIVLVI